MFADKKNSKGYEYGSQKGKIILVPRGFPVLVPLSLTIKYGQLTVTVRPNVSKSVLARPNMILSERGIKVEKS